MTDELNRFLYGLTGLAIFTWLAGWLQNDVAGAGRFFLELTIILGMVNVAWNQVKKIKW